MSDESCPDILYRVDELVGYGPKVSLHLFKFRVIRNTPKGFVVDHWGTERFVLRGDGKRFAYPTIEKAFESWCRRKSRQYSITRARHERAAALQAHAIRLRVNIAKSSPETEEQWREVLNIPETWPLGL